MIRTILPAAALVLVAACSPKAPSTEDKAAPAAAAGAEAAPAAAAIEAPAGTYALDKSHATLTFTVDHLGFSNYTAGFSRFDATLQFDPAAPETMSVTATIDPMSLTLSNPPPGFLEELTGTGWLEAADFPQMAFRSTKVEPTGARTARVTGDFTMHGVTAPVVLEATFNGGYAGFPPYDPNARIGFSATGKLDRSAFGVAAGLPPPGSKMGVGDTVTFAIEAEFNGPPSLASPP